jgi:hypothetical protein
MEASWNLKWQRHLLLDVHTLWVTDLCESRIAVISDLCSRRFSRYLTRPLVYFNKKWLPVIRDVSLPQFLWSQYKYQGQGTRFNNVLTLFWVHWPLHQSNKKSVNYRTAVLKCIKNGPLLTNFKNRICCVRDTIFVKINQLVYNFLLIDFKNITFCSRSLLHTDSSKQQPLRAWITIYRFQEKYLLHG